MASEAEQVRIEADRENQRENGGIQVIARATSILRALQKSPQGLGLSQIAREVGLPRSTVHRIVGALEQERFVSPALPDGRIRLGAGLIPLAASVNSDLRRVLYPYLQKLFLEVNETIDLAVLDKDQVLFIDQIAAPHRLQAISGIGLTFPLHCTANGKALLAELPRTEVEQILHQELPSLTPNTITLRDQLLEELEKVKADKVAYDREEHTIGICAAGVAVRDTMDRLAAITIPVPSIRFYGNEARFAAALLRTRDLINGELR